MSPDAKLTLLCLMLVASCRALSPSRLYSYGQDWADDKLPAADEVASSEIALRTPFVFYGATYTSLFVNMNGFISFLTEIPSFFNIQFPLDYPIIAALYSDVDTTSRGNVWFRETSDPSTTARIKSELGAYFAAAADFTPTGVFIATWDGVAGHRLRGNKVNTFQIVLATDGHESYVVILYADRGLQWLKGKGKNPSLPDAIAQAGFISGDGRMMLIKGSGKDQVRNLNKWSNVGEPGVWVYRVGQIDQTSILGEPDLVSLSGSGTDDSCSVGGLVCHSTASCLDYSPGFCCRCPDHTFGNGINCVKRDEPLRVTGKVTGNLNGVQLEESDLHSYVLTAEGRTYTAVSRVPKNQGYDMQTLVPIGTGISWLFAKPTDGVPNGFTFTGGLMNRTVTLDFPQTGHSASVQQIFMGLDVFENVEVNTFIAGTLPNIPFGSKIEVLPFNEEYTKVKQGQLRARSNRAFRLKGQELETPFQVETTIDFDECSWRPQAEGHETLRLKVSDNIFIQYDAPEKIVRFALSSSIGPLAEEDPCIKGRDVCGHNSECVVDGDTYRCICDRGYEQVFDPSADAAVCVDKDECATGRHQCHERAVCTNNPGSFSCVCGQGYMGDGFRCQSDDLCASADCDSQAACLVEEGRPRCYCPSHMAGDGYHCEEYEDGCASVTCDPQAVCLVVSDEPRCFCPPDTTGDGYYCVSTYGSVGNEIQGSQECGGEICGMHSECKYDEHENREKCFCRTGYSGDGQNCDLVANAVSCNIEENCSAYGSCQEYPEGTFYCECLAGFTGDGYTCYSDVSPPDPNYPLVNIHPVPIDKISDYVLGGDYENLPVEFGENPYPENDNAQSPYPEDSENVDVPYDPYLAIPSSGGEHVPEEIPPYHHDPNEDQIPPYDINSESHTGINFDNEALRPAYPSSVPHVPAPYVPPYVPQDPLRPYEPQPDADTYSVVDPQCSLGTCYCPPGYKFQKFLGKCRMQSMEEYAGSHPMLEVTEAPRPYCGAAKCTCPEGYSYNQQQDSCEHEQPHGEDKPSPDCEGDRFPCLCPQGYYYQYPENTCEPRPAEDVGDIHSEDMQPLVPHPDLIYPGYDHIPGEDTAGMLDLPNYDGYPMAGTIDVKPRPLPECIGDRLPCICPRGYYFQFPQRTCEPSGDENYNYGIQGGGQPYAPFPGFQGQYPPEGQPQPSYPVYGGQHPGGQPQPSYPVYGGQHPDGQPQPSYPVYGGEHPGGQPQPSYPVYGGEHPGGQPQPPYPVFGHHPEGGEPQPPYTVFGQQFPEGGPPPAGVEIPYQFSCNTQDICNEYATCFYESEIDIHLCKCNPGFVGDGFACFRQDFSCDLVNICHVNAQCIHDDLEMRSVCVCLTGYVGDGTVCTPEDECNSVQDCDINAQCGFDQLTQRYRCTCNGGYTGDGRTCVPTAEEGCNVVSTCHHNADCVFDTVALTHRCQCRAGYEGDGNICNEIQLNCHVLQNCGQHSECQELGPRDYRCVCSQGYTGDGYYCQPTQSCQQDPGKCHQQARCQPDPTSSLGYSCQCQRGYIGDGYTCVEAPTFESGLLLLNQGVSVLRMPVSTLTPGGGYPIAVNAYMSAVGGDVDCFAGRYYWTDVRTSTIRSCNYDGTERKPVISQGIIGSPEDIAVDWISRNIYWTDSGNDEIVASSIDEGLRRSIITGDLVNPRGIAVHPGRGLLFWSDWNRDAPKIESSGLDGSDRRVLVSTNIELPNSLVVDYETSTLCWADAGTHKIECIGVNGVDRRAVIKGPQYPFGLTLHEHHFYYTDWKDRRIHAVNKYTGSEEPSRPAPPGGSGRLYDIVAVPDSCPPVSNACQVERGRCPPDMLCLPNSSGGHTCACPSNPPAMGEQYQGCSDTAH